MYLSGQSTEPLHPNYFTQSFQEAAKWFRVAAEKDHARAQVALGRLYRDGTGVIQDGQQAVYWFQKAADQGYYQARLALGDIYAYGKVVPQDFVQAAKWYKTAAEHNSSTGQASLGLLYYLGNGVPKDDVQAYMWLNLAIAHYLPTDDIEKKFLEDITSIRSEIAARLGADQLVKAQRLSRDWKPIEEKPMSGKRP